MGFPGAEADPAKVQATLLAHHVIAASVLLYSGMTLWTLLHSVSTNTFMACFSIKPSISLVTPVLTHVSNVNCLRFTQQIIVTNLSVGSNPIGRLTIIITLFVPLLQPLTLNWVMPTLTTRKAEAYKNKSLICIVLRTLKNR